jgi:poly-beta-1,6-N-acetyl-D-glucosamine biosynthesis protein PgaD
MKPDTFDAITPIDTPSRPVGVPPERIRDWSERRDAPILDAARVPLKTLLDNNPKYKGWALYLWLNVVRPLLVIALWVFAFGYTIRHFFRPTEQLDDYRLLLFYGAVIVGIFIIMLMLAPARRSSLRIDEYASQARRSTPDELAAYAALSNQRLSRWRFTRRLLAHHDKQGRLRHAADLDSGLAAASPIGSIGIDTPVAGPRPPSQG